MQASICVFANDSYYSQALIQAIANEFALSAVVIEQGGFRRRWRLIRHRAKSAGLWTVIRQLAFVLYDRMYICPQSRKAVARALPIRSAHSGVPTYHFESVNEQGVLDLLARIKPSVCIVSGTSIIKARVLRSAPVFMNIHCGITPKYRGVHGGFWAVVNGDTSNAGVTIHLVDRGVDTGSILYQEHISIGSGDTHRTLVAKQYAVGIPLMVQAVRDSLSGKLKPHMRDDLPSHQWSSPTLADYKRFIAAKSSLHPRRTTQEPT